MMRRRRWLILSVFAACLGFVASARAQLDVPATWIDDGKSAPQPKLADIGVPRTAGALKLIGLGDFGSARDTVARYSSADGKLIGTIYLYQNGAADAVLAKIATVRVVASRFGAAARQEPDMREAIGRAEGSALVSVFTNGTPPPEIAIAGPVTTASAFARTLFTIVKVRVTGPDAQRADVLDALRAVLRGLEFRKKDKPMAISNTAVGTCVASLPNGSNAIATNEKLPLRIVTDIGMNLIGGEPGALDQFGGQVCLVTPEPGAKSIILRSTKPDDGHRIVLIGDSGTTLIIEPLRELGKDHRLFATLYSPRGFARFGPLNHVPSNDQLLRLDRGETEWLGIPLAQIAYDPSGNINTSINTGRAVEQGKQQK